MVAAISQDRPSVNSAIEHDGRAGTGLDLAGATQFATYGQRPGGDDNRAIVDDANSTQRRGCIRPHGLAGVNRQSAGRDSNTAAASFADLNPRGAVHRRRHAGQHQAINLHGAAIAGNEHRIGGIAAAHGDAGGAANRQLRSHAIYTDKRLAIIINGVALSEITSHCKVRAPTHRQGASRAIAVIRATGNGMTNHPDRNVAGNGTARRRPCQRNRAINDGEVRTSDQRRATTQRHIAGGAILPSVTRSSKLIIALSFAKRDRAGTAQLCAGIGQRNRTRHHIYATCRHRRPTTQSQRPGWIGISVGLGSDGQRASNIAT